MRLSKERLEHLIAQSREIVIATDAKGMVTYYNDGAKRSLAYSQEEILGQFVDRLYPDLAEAKRVMDAMRDPGHGGFGIVETFQTTFVSKAGVRIPVAISGTMLFDDEGEEDGTIGFAKDLREILRKDQLATLGEVAIGLSHEINSPLTVILNQVELLEQDIAGLAGDKDSSVESERLYAMRREISRICGILARLGEMVETEDYETVEYLGPARMLNLRPHRSTPAGEGPQLDGLRVLVVDDDLGVCGSLKEILESRGCTVETAGDGTQAMRRLDAASFDLVLSDVVMPNMNGHELYHTVHERDPGLPVLMMTSFHYDKDHIIKRSRIEGLEGVIFKKPVDPEHLCRVIADTVAKARGAA